MKTSSFQKQMKMCSYRWLCVISILGISDSACSGNKAMWKQKEKEYHCGKGTYYHCLKSDNNRTMEICIPRIFIDKGDLEKCPVLSSRDNRTILFEPCEQEGCPNSSYVTSELYAFPVCFGDGNVLETSTNNGSGEYSTAHIASSSYIQNSPSDDIVSNREDTSTVEEGQNTRYLILGTGLALVVMLNVLVITFYCIRKRRRRQMKSSDDEQQPGSIAVMSEIYDHANINPCNNMSTTWAPLRALDKQAAGVSTLNENEDIYNHLQSRRVILDQPILYDSD